VISFSSHPTEFEKLGETIHSKLKRQSINAPMSTWLSRLMQEVKRQYTQDALRLDELSAGGDTLLELR